MAKYLIIVESPAKAGTIKKILGPDYEVTASYGHVRDLPKTKLGVDVDNNFTPSYITIKGKADTIKKLKDLAKKSDKVFLASDPDREGEAIAWHLATALKLPMDKSLRVEFNEITKTAVKDAIKKPRQIDGGRVDAQQARRILDRLVGYKISPLLWNMVDSNTSAGRVQSVALKLICDLEDEIKAFIPETYWEIAGEFEKKLILKLYMAGSEKGDRIFNREIVDKLISDTKEQDFKIVETSITKKSKKPPLPLKTSTLQQLASSALGFNPSRTMRIAQALYEGIEIKGAMTGLITYMRTDSSRISDEAKQSTQNYIKEIFGEKYVGDYQPPKSKGKIQDAHEAIRPSDILKTPDSIKNALSPEQYKLYKLIWERFLISQFSNLVYDQQEIIVERSEYKFRGILNKIIFDGYYKIMKDDDEAMNAVFLDVKEGDTLTLSDLKINEGVTKPPARFSEASLIKKLESEGIGRPSTYATIVETLKKRDYVKLEKKVFLPTILGYEVRDKLEQFFPNIMNIHFTAEMEEDLDKVEEGERNWVEIISTFYSDLKKYLAPMEAQIQTLKDEQVFTDVRCSECGSQTMLKTGRFGKFLQCVNENCQKKQSIPKGVPVNLEKRNDNNEIIILENYGKAINEKEGLKTDVICRKCGHEMIIKKGRFGHYFACSNSETCDNKFSLPREIKLTDELLENEVLPLNESIIKIENANKELIGENGICEKCGHEMVIKTGRYGKFLACSNYPECKNIVKIKKK